MEVSSPSGAIGGFPIYPDHVGRQPKGKTFADIVRDAEANPAPPAPDRSGMVDPYGNRWHEHEDRISPARALQLVQEGAPVAWDPCGCGGYCGFRWYDAEEIARMAASGTPTVRSGKRHHGWLSEWTSADGRALVVAVNEVHWGGVIDG